eukprot:4157001-Prymnesium_polylepis.1
MPSTVNVCVLCHGTRHVNMARVRDARTTKLCHAAVVYKRATDCPTYVCVLRFYGDGGREQGTRAGTRERRN